MKKVISLILSVVMLVSIIPAAILSAFAESVKEEPSASVASSYAVGDITELGSYPQSKVTDSSLLSALNAKTLSWKSYNYYSGDGNYGSMKPGDFMKYADVSYGSAKYRAVKFSSYRPYWTEDSDTASNSYQYDNGYNTNTVYWFKYEPLKWKILDPKTGLVMCLNIIDSQAYSNTIYSGANGYYKDSACIIYANNYYESSLRKWLNDDFYNTAFSSSEKKYINTTELDNSAYSSSYSKYDSKTSKDKVFLLSYKDMLKTEYGFNSSYSNNDTARRKKGTDYAKCQGLWVSSSSSYSGNGTYWLRSAGDNSWDACRVSYGGYVFYFHVDGTSGGVCPALNLNRISGICSSESISDCTSTDSGMITFNVYNGTDFLNGTLNLVNNQEGSYNFKQNGVSAVYGGNAENFDGTKSITKANLDTYGVTFKKSGFRNYIVPASVAKTWESTNANKNSKTSKQEVYMAPDANDGRPYVSTIFAKASSLNANAYTEVQTKSLNVLKNTNYNIVMSSPSSNISSYIISQDDAHKISNSTGVFSSVDLYSKFTANAKVYAYVINSDGKASLPIEVKIQKQVTDSATAKFLSSSTLSLLGKDGAKVKVGDKIPLIGGSEIGLNFANFPLGVDIDNDTVKISIGLNIFDSTESSKNNKWLNFKGDCKSLSSNLDDSKKALKEFKKLKNKYVKNFSYSKTKNSFNADFLGYMECKIVNGKLVVLEAGGTVSAEFEYNYTYHTVIGPVPVYVYAKAALDASLQVSRAKMTNDSQMPVDFSVILDVAPSLKVGAGVGVKGVASAGVYGKGTLDFMNNFATKYRDFSLKGEFGVEGEFFIFSGKKVLVSGTMNIWKGYYGSKSSSSSVPGTNPLSSTIGKTEITLADRAYADKTSKFNTADLTSAGDSSATDLSDSALKTATLQSSVYKNSQPQVVKFGNKLLTAYITDDSQRDTYNRYKLVYSVFNGSSWSTPKAVADSGTMDALPSLVSDGTNVYIAWQSIKTKLSSATSQDQITTMKNSEIKYAKYNSSADAFEDVKTITNNQTYDYYPTIALENGSPVIYYANTTNTASSVADGTYKVYKYASGTATALKSSLNYIQKIVADGSDYAFIENGNNVYTEDDYSVSSSNNTLYVNGSSYVIEDGFTTSDIAYGNFGGTKTLFVSDGNNIYYLQNGSPVAMFNSPTSVQGGINVFEYQGKTTATWLSLTEKGSEIYYSNYENGAWTSPVAISSYGALVSNLTTATYNGTVDFIFNKTARTLNTEDENNKFYESGSTDLCFATIGDYTDISADVLSIDESEISDGAKIAIPVSIENLGTKTVGSVTVTVADSQGNSYKTTKAINLASGGETTIDADYTVAEPFEATNLTVSAETADDANADNNSSTYSLGNADISMSDIDVDEVGETYVISGIVANKNSIPAEGVKADFQLANAEGEMNVINSVDVGTLEGNSQKIVTCVVDKTEVNFGDSSSCAVAVEVSTSTKETITDNNISNSAIDEYHIHEYKLTSTTATCSAPGTGTYTCSCGDSYTEATPALGHKWDSGKITAISSNMKEATKTYSCQNCDETYSEIVSISAQSCGDDAYYYFDSDTGVLTIGGTGAIGNYLENDAPWNSEKENIKEIRVLDSVSGIGDYAFCGCTALETAVLPKTITNLGGAVFYNCSSLKNVSLPENVTELNDAESERFGGTKGFFENCSSLETVTLPNGIEFIGHRTFFSCSNLKNIVLPNSVDSLGAYAFWNCSKLESITIPDSVTDIDSDCFNNNPNLVIKCYEDSYAKTFAIDHSINYEIIEKVDDSGIDSISYKRAEPETFYENFGGEHTSEEEEPFGEFYYYRFNDYSDVSDELTINYSDGTTDTFKYKIDDEEGIDGFYNGNGDVLEDSLEFSSDQYTNHWTLGSNNYYTVSYKGKTAKIPVTIKENPVKSISYITAESPKTLYENLNGYIDTDDNGDDFFRYEYVHNIGDKLQISYTNGTSDTYTYENKIYESEGTEENNFFNAKGERLAFECELSDEQIDNHWTVGNTYNYTVSYMGKTTTAQVKIAENPIKSIKYEPKNTVTYVENMGGDYREDDSGNKYYRYHIEWYWSDGNGNGDKLTIFYKDGTSAVYTFSNINGWRWQDENGNEFDGWLDICDNQAEKPWTLGSDNYYWFKYGDVKSNNIPVNIIGTGHTHSYTVEHTVLPTCTKDGLDTYTCSCGESYTQVVAKLGHNYTSAVTAPTCTAQGYTTYTCSRCGDNYKGAYTNALGHSYTSAVTAPTCTAQGYTTHTCTRCSDSYKDTYTNALGHSPASPVKENEVAASVEKDGSYDEVVYCSHCNAELSRTTKTVPYDSFITGKCGADVSYSLNERTGILTISGTGNMYTKDYRINDIYEQSPFYSIRNKNIQTVDIKNGITFVNLTMFDILKSLKTFNVPESVEVMGDSSLNMGRGIYGKINVDANNKNYSSIDGVLYNKDKTMLLLYPFVDEKVVFTVPDGVKKVDGLVTASTIILPTSITYLNCDYNDFKHIVYKGSKSQWQNVAGADEIDEQKIVYNSSSQISGKCGDNINYTIDINSGKLVISGSGKLVYKETEAVIDDEIYIIIEECDQILSYDPLIKDVVIQNGITEIGRSVFAGCSDLKTISIPNSVTSIGIASFAGCDSLPSITIPDGVTSVGDYSFSGCSALANISIPNSVTSIGENAFDDCKSLTSITIPNNITSIGEKTFAYCSGLTSITIPNSVNKIGYNAFYECSNLKKVIYDGSIDQWAQIDYYSSDSNPLNYADELYINEKLVTDVKLSNTTVVSDYAFYNYENLLSIAISNTATSIGTKAFYGCDNLTSITIPNSVTDIGNSSFSGCSSLTSIKIPDSVTSIGESAFNGCSNLDSITIPKSIKTMGCSFDGCGIKEAIFEDGIISIPLDAFYGAKQLESVNIPNSVTSIGDAAFSGCSSLTSITIPNSVTGIGNSAFSGCSSLTNITIPDGVTSIKDSVFSGCSNLANITIPNSVTSIGSDAFYNCSSLTSITIPNGVTSIGTFAFYKCSNLTDITIPDGVTSIEDSVFSGCSNLANITIPNSVTSIGSDAFYNCSSLTSITIPNGVTSIGTFAFYNCSSLTSITIPNGVTSIGTFAFYKCSNLTDITIPNGVTSIGDSAFKYCSNLTKIIIPDTVTSIGDYTFQNCSKLTKVTIPDSITIIGFSVFYGCSSLIRITIPNSVTSICSDAFYNCSSLTSITIPDSVNSIGNYAFYGCNSNFAIKCSVNSYAETYAKNNSVKYFICNTSGIKSLSFVPTKQKELTESKTGYTIPEFDLGDKLTVSYNDGTATVYTCSSSNDWRDASGSVFNFDINTCHNQTDKPWTVGSNNYYWLECEGVKSNNISVLIKELRSIISGQVAKTYLYKSISVKLYQGENVISSKTLSAGSDGKFTFEDIPEGNYSIKIIGNGMLPFIVSNISAANGENIDLTSSSNESIKTMNIVNGDANGDGVVNVSDIALLLLDTTYGKSFSEDVPEDVDGNGVVNVFDIAVILLDTNYGKSASQIDYLK